MRIRLDVAGGATLVLATVVLGLSPFLGHKAHRPLAAPCPQVSGPTHQPALFPSRSLMPLLDPDSGLLVLAGKVSEKRKPPPVSTHVGPQGWCLHLPGLDLTFDLSSQLGEWGVQDATSPERRN